MRISASILTLLLSHFLVAQKLEVKEAKVRDGYPDYIMEAAYSRFNSYFAITVGNNNIEVYDHRNKIIFQHQGNPKAVGGHFDFSHDEQFLYMGKFRTYGDVGILRLSDQKLIQVIGDHSTYVSDVDAHPTKHIFATVSSDNTVRVYGKEGEEFKPMNVFTDHDKSVTGVSFSYDGKYLATCGRSKKIIIYKWNKDKYAHFQTISTGKTYQESVSFHPSSYDLVSAYYQVKRYTFKGSSFVLKDSVKFKGGSMRDIVYSPAGEYISACKYNDVLLLSSKDLSVKHTMYRHQSSVFSSSFTEDGKKLVTSSHDRTAITWELTNVKPAPSAQVVGYLMFGASPAHKRILTDQVAKGVLAQIPAELKKEKDEFETSKSFAERKDKRRIATLGALLTEIEKKYTLNGKPVKGETAKFRIDRLIHYDADAERYTVELLGDKVQIKIDPPAAKALKQNAKKAYVVGTKKTVDGVKTYKKFSLVHPSGSSFELALNDNPFEAAEVNKGVNDKPQTADQKLAEGVGRTHALLIATNEYDHFDNLVNPVIDAKTIRKELETYYECKVDLIESPKLDELVKTIKAYAAKKYNPQDQLFIFIAGHGYYDDVFKEGYVITKDSRSDDVAHTSFLSHSNLRTMINNIPCPHIFLCMDVCFAGTFDPLIASTNRSTDMYQDVDKQEFIKRKLKYKTRMYLTSGGKEYVPDGRPGQHSPFARKILEGLRNYGGNDGILTLNELVSFVEKVDPQPRFGEFGDNEPGSDFLFIKR